VARFSASLRLEEIPPEVREAGLLHLLDAIGCGFAAYGLGVGTSGVEAIERRRSGGAAVIGGGRADAAQAVLANGMLCHALDFDDTHPAAVCHVGAVIAPTACAVGEEVEASGAEVLAAAVAGCEVMVRLGLGARNGMHRRGFHPTGVCGALAAAAIASRLYGLDATTTVDALGVCGSLSSGIFAYLADGTPTKPLHAGWAGHAGIMAARLARHGLRGPRSVLEGKFGLYDCFAELDEAELRRQVDGLGNDWETPRIAFKPYPACHAMHGVLTAAESALAQRQVNPTEIIEVGVAFPPEHLSFIAEPSASKVRPRTGYEAKFSVQYSIAALLSRGQLDLSSYREEAIRDETVLSLADRVVCEPTAYSTYPGSFPGGVRIRTAEGDLLAADVEHELGGWRNPLGEKRVREKFRRNACLTLEAAQANRLERSLMQLEHEPSWTLLAPA
jgi:2-methylcitrate dehydratase PrpD